MASGFLKGTLILTIAGFVVKAIGSINWILLSRILGGEGIGIYQMAFPHLFIAITSFKRRCANCHLYFDGRTISITRLWWC